jgi:para-aminobenzoate synthetase component 1
MRRKAWLWAQQFEHLHFFNGMEVPSYPYGVFPQRLAAGCVQEFRVAGLDTESSFARLQAFHQQTGDWLVGYLGYDLKNEIEKLRSQNEDRLGFPLACFYQPRHLIDFREGEMIIHSLDDPAMVFEEIRRTVVPEVNIQSVENGIPHRIRARVSREMYLQRVAAIQQHILEGDVYELNYCMEYFAEEAVLDPAATYERLNGLSPTPFSVFQRIGSHYLLCASPERFLKKAGNRLISQPIKGTIRRGENEAEDQLLRNQLRNDEKELAENMMIVDLVRNDLSRSARTGSVKVEEMFGIYSFRQVHQMISTVTAQLKETIPFTEAIRQAFPMGSMTGAPKIRAMELIDQYEQSRRGLFSGAVGYITPEGDFDFNVVIRSILYNATNQYLSFHVGSAITYDSVPDKEYEECLLKAQAIFRALSNE